MKTTDSPTLRSIQTGDNEAIRHVIQTVMPEFGCVGEGYSINDPEVQNMAEAYAGERADYFVIELDSGADAGARVVGGAGYAPLTGADPTICELRKMYLLPETRGLGAGQLLIDTCLTAARRDGFTQMYLETVEAMTGAARLYLRNGFAYLDEPLGHTGHTGCGQFMLRLL